MQALVRVMCHHGQGPQLCPLCDCPSLCEASLLNHLLVVHAHPLGLGDLRSVEDMITSVKKLKHLKFSKLKNLFNAFYYLSIFVWFCVFCICMAMLLVGMQILILTLKDIHCMCVNNSNLLAVALASQREIKYVKMKLKIDSCVRGHHVYKSTWMTKLEEVAVEGRGPLWALLYKNIHQ